MGVATETVRAGERLASFENRVDTGTLLKAVEYAIASKRVEGLKFFFLASLFWTLATFCNGGFGYSRGFIKETKHGSNVETWITEKERRWQN